MSKRGIGYKYELYAKEYLINKGLEYIESNFYTNEGEIDLIFRENNILVFVEVRYRNKGQLFGKSEESLSNKKIDFLRNTALNYITKNKWDGNIRFDLIAINGDEVNWLVNII